MTGRFKPFLAISFAIASVDFSSSWLGYHRYIPESLGYSIRGWLCVIWALFFALGIGIYKKRVCGLR
jgi:hypothetical protein